MTLFHKTKINIQKAREKRKKLSHSLKVFFLVLDEQNFYFYYVINYLNKKGEHLVKYDWCFMQKTNHKTNKKFTQQTFHCLDNFT